MNLKTSCSIVFYFSWFIFFTFNSQAYETYRKPSLVFNTFINPQSLVLQRVFILVMASGNLASSEVHEAQQQAEAEKKEPLLLMDSPAEDVGVEKTHTLGVGEAAVSFDHLGPLVINTDGSISRISNWDTLSEIERTRTSRLVIQRNAQRLTRLQEKEANEAKPNEEQSKEDHHQLTSESHHEEL